LWYTVFHRGESSAGELSGVFCNATAEFKDGDYFLSVNHVGPIQNLAQPLTAPTERDYVELCGVNPATLPLQASPFVLQRVEARNGKTVVMLQNVWISFSYELCAECLNLVQR
jgi:hypothetical protein